jgi:hydroxypyruvate isomerase
MRRRALLAGIASVAAAPAPTRASSPWPQRPITLIVPWPAGGQTDLTMRLLGDLAARHEVPNVIAMFGNRGGRSDAAVIAASIEGLSKIKPLAEQHQVTVCVELLNSKVDHRDYQGDRTAFGVEVMKGVASSRVKLLYDIYHMQIMEGDVIRTIRDHIAHIGHFHTGGVPGRHELDAKQELNWRAIATAIADTSFSGFVAHEFMPTGDPLTSLKAAFDVFDV